MDDMGVVKYRKIIISLDQYGRLISIFSAFKESQTDIIPEISEIILYILNDLINDFFDLTHTIKSNATFRTYTDAQYEEMSETRTFYEIKNFSTTWSSYIKMITNDRFDIASLIPAEMVDIGVTCQSRDDTILGHAIFKFNTLFRFAIKHVKK